jgi:hypothetical protein
VSASGQSDVWAVGQQRYGQNTYHTWTAHWDGTTWATVPSPNVGTGTSALYGVVAISPTDAWAVGYSQDYSGNPTLTMHWDGSAWTVVPSPSIGSLRSVAALASNDIWAVGTDGANTMVLHWTGSGWTPVPSPSLAGWDNTLEGITARTPDDIWAVGEASTSTAIQAIIEHWDGSAWTLVPSPAPGSTVNYLEGVVALAENDVWAVGGSADGTNLVGTLVEHWNGSAWTIVPGPPVVGFFYSVAGRTANNLWAAGTYVVAPNTNNQTLLAHWDGSTWTQVSSPNPGYGNNWLYSVTLLSDSEGWAVGSSSPGPPVLHYTPACGSPGPTGTPSATPTGTPSATPTGTPSTTPTGTAQATPAPPTATPSATPPTPMATATATLSSTPATTPSASPCPLQFTDVDPGNPFYDYIGCLACRGIIGGYPCGGPGEPCPGAYFRPNTPVTRGQVSKIVSLAAGLADAVPSTQQTFEDVPPGGTFWVYIERLAGREIIGGYACGGPFEPCVGPGNRPYFRPNNDVTRGQIAKIVSGAAGWTETPTGQTFEDVPSASTFYLWIERVAVRGIVGGYPCGGDGEPCLPPGNRPYFRPNNPATRGQLSKIAASTFFPHCATPAQR